MNIYYINFLRSFYTILDFEQSKERIVFRTMLVLLFCFFLFRILLYSLKKTFRGRKIVWNSMQLLGIRCKGRFIEFSGFPSRKTKRTQHLSTRQLFLPSKTFFFEYFLLFTYCNNMLFSKIKSYLFHTLLSCNYF